MAVPFATQMQALSVAVKAAGNLTQASLPVVNALAYQAGLLASSVEAAIPNYAGALDTWTSPTQTGDIATGILGLQTSTLTQLSLADLEGYVARIAINLENR
jgi:hypothetical protein